MEFKHTYFKAKIQYCIHNSIGTLPYVIVCTLLVFDRNSLNHITVNILLELWILQPYNGVHIITFKNTPKQITMYALSYLPTPPLGQDMTEGQFCSGVYQVWIRSFHSPRLVASSKLKISLPYYIPTAGERIIGFIPFPRVLVLCEMQSVWSKIWTRVAVSISYDDNHYTTDTSQCTRYNS